MGLRVDFLTGTSLVLFLVANSVEIAQRRSLFTIRDDISWSLWKDLDPDYLRDRWVEQTSSSSTAGGFWIPLAQVLRAVAWVSLIVPVVEVAWIQSLGGQRRRVLHASVVLLVVSGSFTELVGRFMAVGVEDATRHLMGHFQLDDWDTAVDGNADGMGWRVLDLGHMVFQRGLLQWIDAFEWIALFGFLSLLYHSVHAKHETFSTKWTALGLLIAMLSVADFAAEVARLDSWIVASRVALVLTSLNTVILLPVWLLWLALRLPHVRDDCERLFERDEGGPPPDVSPVERASMLGGVPPNQFPIPAPPPGTLGQEVIGAAGADTGSGSGSSDTSQPTVASKTTLPANDTNVDDQVGAYASKLRDLGGSEIL